MPSQHWCQGTKCKSNALWTYCMHMLSNDVISMIMINGKIFAARFAHPIQRVYFLETPLRKLTNGIAPLSLLQTCSCHSLREAIASHSLTGVSMPSSLPMSSGPNLWRSSCIEMVTTSWLIVAIVRAEPFLSLVECREDIECPLICTHDGLLYLGLLSQFHGCLWCKNGHLNSAANSNKKLSILHNYWHNINRNLNFIVIA